MGVSGSCSTCSTEQVLELSSADRCAHFCGDRQCRVTCSVRRVVIWRRRGSRPAALGAFQRATCVEVRPVGVAGQAQRTEAGQREERDEQESLVSDKYKETWVWGSPKTASRAGGRAASSRPGLLAFQVPISAQLALSVLESQGPWWFGGAAPNAELLGEARLRICKDILAMGSRDSLPTAYGPGELALPLVLDSCICGLVEVAVSLHCEDLLREFRSLAGEAGLPQLAICGCSDDGLRTQRPDGAAEKPRAAERLGELSFEGHAKAMAIMPPPVDALWSPRGNHDDGARSPSGGLNCLVGRAGIGCIGGCAENLGV